ncbi:MAG: NirD/YgiW/YdeI family stress tolerance protein [Bdellovibrionales bacterium]
MNIRKTIAVTSLAVLLSSTALAANTASAVKDMPDGGQVTLSGTVEEFNNEKSFTLRDSSGTVKVDMGSAKSVVLKNGEKVTVNGTVDKGITGTTIAATSVAQDKAIGQQVGEAIDSVTGQDQAANAQPVNIKSLPDSGLVKLQGTVEDVSSEKKFTLKDSTGSVDVSLKSSESAALHKGSGVTVVGYVNKGLMGKSIDATKVDIRNQ